MDIQIKYIESQSNSSTMRRGGVILKGAPRTEKQPVHLLFLVDTSGSMEESQKLVTVKKSMNFILPFLSENDEISLITFDDDAVTHITRSAVTAENKQALEYRIQEIHTNGSTNLSAGLLSACDIFEQARNQANTNTKTKKQGLIVLTDGYANVGIRDENMLLDLVRTQILAKNPGLSLTTVAYGVEHNAELLSKMSIEGGGSYNIVKNLEDVASVFGEILGGLLSISAQRVEVHFPPDVQVTTVYPVDILEGGVTRVRIGDLYAEADQVVLFKSSPNQGPIRITGISLPSFERIDESHEPIQLIQGNEPDQLLKMADYRGQVSKLLKDFRLQLRASDEILEEARDLKLLLESSSFHESILIQMMIEDLVSILQINPLHLPLSSGLEASLTSQMVQHETYLGIARGLRSPQHRRRTNTRNADSQGTITPPGLLAQTSIFSNTVQRNLTDSLRSMSMQPE